MLYQFVYGSVKSAAVALVSSAGVLPLLYFVIERRRQP